MITQVEGGGPRRLVLAAAILLCGVAVAHASGEPVDADWWGTVQRDIAASEYEVTWQRGVPVAGLDGAWQAPNRAHGLRTWFTPEGIRVVPRAGLEPSWVWGLALVGYGRGGETRPVPPASPLCSGARVEYPRARVTEWYLNDRAGLEQGFRLTAPPQEMPATEEGSPPVGARDLPGVSTGPAFLVLVLSGDLSPILGADRQTIDFVTPRGARAVRYAELKVTDASGRVLASWMEGFAERGVRGIRLVFDDARALYPITVDPLATSPTWTAEGDQANACFAESVGTAGDVDRDGYGDVIVGAPCFDAGQDGEGRAFVYLGSAAGLALTAAWTAESDQQGAYFGYSVATAGDVNGDGYSDVIVGASLYDNPDYDEGRAYVFLGAAAGLGTSPVWTAEGGQGGAEFGTSVAPAGDVNGDGFGDVLVGAPDADGGGWVRGSASVFHGSLSGPGSTPAWSATGAEDGDSFGRSVAMAGDVDGDGYTDVIVGAPSDDDYFFNPGHAYVYRGSASGLAATPVWAATDGLGGGMFGISVATAGDVNGDGYSDIGVGAPQSGTGGIYGGSVTVYHGSAAGPSSSPSWQKYAAQAGARLGVSLATAGDVNGDGYADLVAGAEQFDGAHLNEGAAFVYAGSPAGLSSNAYWSAQGQQEMELFGRSVGTAGDVNGDGYSDVIVGSPYRDSSEFNDGAAFVYLGSAAGLSADAGWAVESDQAEARLGWAVGTAGDVNGDGYADVIVGAPQYDGGQLNEGRVLVYHGAATGLSADPAWTAESDVYGGPNFGYAVGTAGDVNGDGYSDVIVGANTFGNPRLGRAFVYHGAASGLAASPAWTADGAHHYSDFGGVVATAGDVNGDGYADVIVGAYRYESGRLEGAEGRAYVYHGSAAGLAASPAWTVDGVQAWEGVGESVGTAGDVNGDGYSDVIVGAPGHDGSLLDAGRAYVYHGSAAGLAGAPAWTVDGEQASSGFGSSVGTAGDVNGDGYADVIVGAAWFNAGEPYWYPDVGRAYVYHGGAAGLSTIPVWTADSGQLSALFGSSAGTAGDVNGDGYADVVVGSWLFENGQTNEGRAYVYHGSAAGLAASPAWTAEGDLTDAYLGHCVGTAGDVNGDGYADVIVGAYGYNNGQTEEGRALLYYGNDGPGLSLRPRQTGPAGRPIAPSGRGPEANRFDVHLDARTPFGRGRVGLEWEVEPYGTLFDGMGLGRLAPDADTGTGGVTLSGVTVNLSVGSLHHWRARLLYRASTTPFQQRSRWITMPWNGWQEVDLRTRQDADLSVSQTDSPDPVFTGHSISYAIVVSNGGDSAPARLVDTLPAGTVFLAADPSQGSCAHASGIVTCDLGAIDSGGSATVTIEAQAPSTATLATNLATASTLPSGLEVDPADDSSSETTDVRAVNIGDVVWRDDDGNGIQDPGEATIPRVVVLLYNGAGDLLGSAETNQFGYYVFPYLTYGAAYRLRFVLPAGYAFTARDQGGDDAQDSDADPVTGETDSFSLTEFSDATHWDAGLVFACLAPDETVYIYRMTLTPDGKAYPVIHFQDPNQPSQVTGYNVYRSDSASRPKEEWPLVASDVVDMDEAEPNRQWVDTSGDDPPTGAWFYDVAAYNHRCPAEGPR